MDVILMKIENVPGTSLMTGFTGQIEAMSYSHGVAMQVTGDVSNTERTSGKPRHQDFMITKYLDKASPLLNQKCCEGTDLGTVLITVGRNDNGSVIPLIVYTLSNAVLSSVNVGGGGGDKPVESLALNYSGIKWDFTAQKEAGGKDGTVAGSWDLGKNAKS
ncbi:MAG TPA: type VI secretion system tube protein Hcp [Longimicrobium sp.]|jgi:type VI secretion system secreted protein Hcp|uniref:Hcp family type VI secretion system effector n=1 Tax=Longimicrobium sp. TaxID=2029185 RepID=UPI002EDA38FD